MSHQTYLKIVRREANFLGKCTVASTQRTQGGENIFLKPVVDWWGLMF
jgi:hypothetical protein